MTRNALYYAILMTVAALTVGVLAGLFLSPRITAVAAIENYRQGIDLDLKGRYERERLKDTAACELRVTDMTTSLTTQVVDAQRTGEVAVLEATHTLRRAEVKHRREAEAFSGEIESLRQQLTAHGIVPLRLRVQ